MLSCVRVFVCLSFASAFSVVSAREVHGHATAASPSADVPDLYASTSMHAEDAASNTLTASSPYALMVDGAPYFAKGVCYSPIPIGETPDNFPFGDYFLDEYEYIWQRDLPAIRDMGANTITIYGWNETAGVSHKKFFDAVHKNGLKVIVIFFLGVDGHHFLPSYTNDDIIKNFTASVLGPNNENVGHPGILAWSFGNEVNGAWNKWVNRLGGIAPLIEWVGQACDAAGAAVRALGKVAKPCTTMLADLAPPYDLGAAMAVPDIGGIDFWGIHLYRGKDFTNFFEWYKGRATAINASTLPVMVTEYGVDAYNDPCGINGQASSPIQMGDACTNLAEFPPAGTDASGHAWGDEGDLQAEWDVALSQIMLDHSVLNATSTNPVSSGGTIMDWVDGFWKNTQGEVNQCWNPCTLGVYSNCQQKGGPHAHIDCREDIMDINYNALCGYYNGAQPDSYINEGWWGLVKPVRCVQGRDVLQPRKVYFALQAIWRDDGKKPSSFGKCPKADPPLMPRQYPPTCFPSGGSNTPTTPPGSYLTYSPTDSRCYTYDGSCQHACAADTPWGSPKSGSCHATKSKPYYVCCCKGCTPGTPSPTSPTPAPSNGSHATPAPSNGSHTTPVPSNGSHTTPAPTKPNSTTPPTLAPNGTSPMTHTPTTASPTRNGTTGAPTSGGTGVWIGIGIGVGVAAVVALGVGCYCFSKRNAHVQTDIPYTPA